MRTIYRTELIDSDRMRIIMQTQTYNRKPLTVEAVQVTDENLYDVAKWCGGEVRSHATPGKKFILVDVLHPLNSKQTKASPGDWVLKSDQGYKIYANSAFLKGFDLEVVEDNYVGAEAQFASSLREGLGYGPLKNVREGSPVNDLYLSKTMPADKEA